MAKIAYGIKDRTPQRIMTGVLSLEEMTLEMADEGIDTIQGMFEKFDGKLVKIVIEELAE